MKAHNIKYSDQNEETGEWEERRLTLTYDEKLETLGIHDKMGDVKLGNMGIAILAAFLDGKVNPAVLEQVKKENNF